MYQLIVTTHATKKTRHRNVGRNYLDKSDPTSVIIIGLVTKKKVDKAEIERNARTNTVTVIGAGTVRFAVNVIPNSNNENHAS